jgi:hypothetical protein
MTPIGTPEWRLGGLTWRRSRRSGSAGNCVEIAELPGGTTYAIRDSRDPDGPVLVVGARTLADFVRATRRGEFAP